MTDTAQYEDFVRTHQDLVYGLAYRLLGNDADARDASQQAFLRAWLHWGEIVGSATAAAWLKTVTEISASTTCSVIAHGGVFFRVYFE